MKHRIVGGALSTVVLAVTLGAGSSAAAPVPDHTSRHLHVVAAATAVTITHWPGFPTWPDLGVYVVAGATPFEVRVTRDSYPAAVTATQIVRGPGGSMRTRVLPPGLVTDFDGFPRFMRLRITNESGVVVLDREERFCPNGEAYRARPDAPDRSPYPTSCPHNPFTLGSVWGLQAGWSTLAMDSLRSQPLSLPDGLYTAALTVNEVYADLFGIAADERSQTVVLTIRTELPGSSTDAERTAPVDPARVGPAAGPTGESTAATGRPDLRPLPAWGIRLRTEPNPGSPAPRQVLAFNATVWNAGTTPLVLDGFRRPGQEAMDAYQYFYNARGKEVGYAPVGGMQLDHRDGHGHWHYTEFARYRLLDADQHTVVSSQKAGFCLVSTDAIDMTGPNANWRPGTTDLHTACGDGRSLATRQVLDVGSGDTYTQELAGQSFDITDVPNGTYSIEIAANPAGLLHESDTANNVVLRPVVLGGAAGARTVEVPPYQGIDA
jgi:hypothetical protein